MILKEHFQSGILVFLGAASFGILSSIVKTAYKSGYTVGQITGVQTLFGMIILWGLYLLSKKKNDAKNTTSVTKKNQKWQVCLVGIFPGLVGIFYYQCVQLVPASIAIILLMQYLWISIIIDFLFFKNTPNQLQLLAIILIIGGSCLAAGLSDQGVIVNNLKGYLFGLLAAITYSLFIITSGKVGLQLPTLQKGALMITGACAITFMLFPPAFLVQFSLDNKLYQFGILLALFGTILPPLLFSIGMPKIGIPLSAILSAAELPVAVLSSYFYLHETVNFMQWLGVIIIIVAIILPNLSAAINENRWKS